MDKIHSSTLEGIFDQIYIINLVERYDRRVEISEQLRLVGLTFEDPLIQLYAAHRPKTPGDFSSIGARGCFMSHLDIIGQAMASGHKSILILEDDMDWIPSALALNNGVVSAFVDSDWEFLHGGLGADLWGRSTKFQLNKVEPSEGLLLTHFIGLRGNAIPLAHRYLSGILDRPAGSPLGGPMHVDGAYSWLRKDHEEIESYVCVPSIARQRRSLSDVTPPKGIKSMPIVSHILTAIRKIRNALAR
jgi:glycosyl transferase family 25